jgi:hypothetical protein
MQTEKIIKNRWTQEEKERLPQYAHLSPKEAMPYFPGRTYKSVKSMLYQFHRKSGSQNVAKYYTPRAFYSNMEGLNKNDRFKLEYRLLPQGEVETSDLCNVEVPSVIDFDLYSLRFGFPLSDEILHRKAA